MRFISTVLTPACIGPSTIVGSAAFNLFFIIAICLLAIPADETRRIESLGVFLVTAVFSLFAYLWLIVILVASSPDVIEVWEVSRDGGGPLRVVQGLLRLNDSACCDNTGL